MPRLTLLEEGRIRAANTEPFLRTCESYRGLSDELDWALDDSRWVIDDLRAAVSRQDEEGVRVHLVELETLVTFIVDFLAGLN